MKILHVITTMNRGGAENHLQDLICGQIHQYETEVQCAHLIGDSYWAPKLIENGCPVSHLKLRYYGELSPLFKLRRLLKEFSPDIVHAHLGPAELYARLALLGNSKTPFVITRHNHKKFFNAPGANLVERWVMKRAQHFIGISDSVRATFTQKIPETRDRFGVVHYGVDPGIFSNVSREKILELRREWGVKESTILLGTIARLVPVKSLHTLLEGFALFQQDKEKTDIQLVLVGQGPLESELRERASALGIGSKIIWAGFRSDIPLAVNTFDIFALTSLSEGFGLVTLEAMAASKPVICTRVGSLPEIVVDGSTGFLIPPKQPEAFAAALETLVADQQTRNSFGSSGFERARLFSLSKVVDKTMKIYQNLLSKST